MQEKLFTLSEASELLNVSVITIRRKAKKGELVAMFPKEGGKGRPAMKITVSSVSQYIKNH